MANKLTVLIKPKESQEHVIGQNFEINRQDKSGFYTELVSAGLSCGAATLSWTVVGLSGAATPVTFGSSSLIAVLSWNAAIASSVQCGNSAYRLYHESGLGDRKEIDWLDSQDWYQSTMTALDVISVTGGIAATGVTIKMALALRKSTGKSLIEILKTFNRYERKRITQEVIRGQNPGISHKMLKLMITAGKYPKRYNNFQISNSVRVQLKDALSAAFSFTGSASSGVIRSPERISDMGVAIIEEFESW